MSRLVQGPAELAARNDTKGETDSSELAVTDLMVDAGWVWDELVNQTNARHWLDAFLCCAAAGQMLEDSLHSPGRSVRRAASLLARSPSAVQRKVAAAADGGVHAAELARAIGPAARRLTKHRAELAALAVSLARAARSTQPIDETEARELQTRAHRSAAIAERAGSRLRSKVIRLPACFRSFDQHPVDVETLVDRLAAREPERNRPLVVVGVRTSGSYLAPVAVARLEALGYQEVTMLSVRPGVRLSRADRRTLAAAGAANGLAIVVDDPPVAGNALAVVGRALEAGGMPRESVFLMLATANDDGQLPERLDGYPRIVLRRLEWDIERRLQPTAVATALEALVAPGWRIHGLTPVTEPTCGASSDRREHARAVFDARFEHADGELIVGRVIAEGVGLGWFGRHALAVGGRVADWVPDLLGFHDGVLYQLVRSAAPDATVTPETMADYVAARAQALPTAADRSTELPGRQTVWEVAAEMVGDALGPVGLLARLPLVSPVTRALLRVTQPSVIDGRISGQLWLRTQRETETDTRVGATSGLWCKIDFADRAFSHRELLSYDPAFDVATPLDDDPARDRALTARTRARWEDLTGTAIQPERWLLHRLVHLWDHRRRDASASWFERRVSCALQDYVGEVFLSDVTTGTGPWCALDVDGVLETGVVGGSAPGPLGAGALRALVAHGYRVVLATGRSAEEVRDRCEAWRLPGGVAEYGAALVVDGVILDVRTPDDIDLIEGVRKMVADLDGVELDPSYRHIVRAFRTGSDGRRTALDDDDRAYVSEQLARPDALQMIPGEDQTDIAPAECTKATGVLELLTRLDPETAARAFPLALAVGDGVADLPLFGAAAIAAAPRHAAIAADPRVRVTRRSYQAGLADAVSMELGHRPGACPRCRLDQSVDSRALFGLLSVRQSGRTAIPRLLVRAALDGRRVSRAARPAH